MAEARRDVEPVLSGCADDGREQMAEARAIRDAFIATRRADASRPLEVGDRIRRHDQRNIAEDQLGYVNMILDDRVRVQWPHRQVWHSLKTRDVSWYRVGDTPTPARSRDRHGDGRFKFRSSPGERCARCGEPKDDHIVGPPHEHPYNGCEGYKRSRRRQEVPSG